MSGEHFRSEFLELLKEIEIGDPDAVNRLLIMGDKIQVGDVSGSSAVAIGSDIKITLNRTESNLPDHVVKRLLQLADRLEVMGIDERSDMRRIRIFLSSPSDVAEERGRAMDVIRELQNDPMYRSRVELEVVSWDDPSKLTPLVATKSPQQAINDGLGRPSDCEILVTVFWSRMGTPLSVTEYIKPDAFRFPNESGMPEEQYYSGTEWEYVDGMLSSYETGLPEVIVYRRTADPEINLSDLEEATRQLAQMKLLKAYFASFSDDQGAIRRSYNQYETPDEFQRVFAQHLRVKVAELLERPHPQRATTGAATTSSAELIINWPSDRSPFPGLRAFNTTDKPIYYGREKETAELLKRFASIETRFVAVLGASGSGKSSLVGAGLLPHLHENAIQGSKDWVLPEYIETENGTGGWAGLWFTPGDSDSPFWSLAFRLAPMANADARDIVDDLRRSPERITAYFDMLLDGRPDWASVVMCVDQFEELFTLVTSSEERELFTRLMSAAAAYARARIVISMRSDFADRCAELPALNDLVQGHDRSTFWLSRPRRRALYEMITRPARVTGLRFEDGLDWQILEDTGDEPGALALVAYTLEQLWQRRDDGNLMAWHVYREFGSSDLTGVEGAIGSRAEAVFSHLWDQMGDVVVDALRAVFRELVEVNRQTGAATRRRALLTPLLEDEAQARLIYELADERLLVTGHDDTGNDIVEVAHEALFRSWPLLADWITSSRDDLVLLRQVSTAAGEWHALPSLNEDQKRQKEAFRWPHERLVTVYEMLERLGQPPLEPQVADFIRPEYDRLMDEVFAPLPATSDEQVVREYHRRRGTISDRLNDLDDCERRPGIGVVTEWISALPDDTPVQRLWGADPAHLGLPDICWVPVKNGRTNIDRTTYESRPFHMAQYPVTYRQYRAFLEADDGFYNPVWWQGLARKHNEPGQQNRPVENHPAENVSWYDAIAFCRWLNARLGFSELPINAEADVVVATPCIRLPLEWEWQWVASGQKHSLEYPFGDWSSLKANTEDSGLSRTTAVGIYPAGATENGILDLSGNVQEWCLNDYSNPGLLNLHDNSRRVVRGGSWMTDDYPARAESRLSLDAYQRSDNTGFRLVISAFA